MITDFNTIIIGAGAAGLFAGCNINSKNTLILEKNEVVGKKLMITGAGQCNFTHYGEMQDYFNKYGDNGAFLKPALASLTNLDTIEFFKERGVDSIIREDNKVFPKSLRAKDIINALINGCKASGVEIKYSMTVDLIKYNNELEFFTIKAGNNKYTSKNVIITTGGKAYPNTGSTGDGYRLAEELGHKIEALSPALTPVNVQDYQFSELSGISFESIKTSLYRENKKIKEAQGDLLLTHKNLSGPVILNFSRYINKGDMLKINFMGISNDKLSGIIEEKTKENGKQPVKAIFKDSSLSKRFIEKIFEICQIDDNIICSQLSKKQRNQLIEKLTAYPFIVEGLSDYHIAMCTRGGVSLDEINRKTMQSKLIKGLYFAGEVMDIDADTGGYNIQAAFSTAMLAIKSINKNNTNKEEK